MENQPVVLQNQGGNRALSAAPALPILVKEPQCNGRDYQRTLFSSHNNYGHVSSAVSSSKSKMKTCLHADASSGGITVTLDNNTMWNEFCHRNTEMILTKQGRRMFPYCRYWITGLESNLKYILVMDISPVDNFRYKWNGHSWEPSGKAEPHVLGRVFIHPESPSTGHYWMHQPVSFYKLKLTNNTLDQEGHIILHSMHRYLPRLHLVPADKATEVIQLNSPDVQTFTFLQTEFFAVTAYQNIQITQLKIDYNPFAKGLVKNGLRSSSQCESKQNGRSEHEGFPNTDRCQCSSEADILHHGPRGLNGLYDNQTICNTDLERESFNSNAYEHDEPELKQQTSEFPIANHYECDSHMKSLLTSNGDINVSIKKELVDDYVPNVTMERTRLKQEDISKETEDLSCSGDDPILEKQLKKHRKMGKFHKQSHNSPLDVGKTKMLKLDSRIMPTASVEAGEVTKSMIKISALQALLSSCRTAKSFLKHSEKSFPTVFENSSNSIKVEGANSKNHFSGNNEEQKCKLVKDVPWGNIPVHNNNSIKQKLLNFKCMSSAAAKFMVGEKKPNAAKKPVLSTSNPSVVLSGPCRRGRPRKMKLSKVKQPIKRIRKAIKNHGTPFRLCSHYPEVMFDIEDVDGVLFVSFESKEGLNSHTVDQSGKTGEPLDEQASLQITCNSDTNLSFTSTTGKTDDFRKIKGWQEKIHSASRLKGINLEGSLKNRSAFCSDTLDEYLENEGKLMKTNMGFSPDFSSCSGARQLSSESSSYVQAQHNILKKKYTPPTSYTFKHLSLPSFRKRRRNNNRKKACSGGSIKSNNSAVSSLDLSKDQYHIQVLKDRVTNSQPNSKTDNAVNVLMMPDENVQGNQRTVCQSTWNSHICTNNPKLMDLEGCVLQDGKPRTYITEERADFSLKTLFISQALFNNRHVSKVIQRQTLWCGRNSCQPGYVCACLAFETSRPTISCKTECTFDCMKTEMALKRGIAIRKPLHRSLACCNGQEEVGKLEQTNKWKRTNDDAYKTELEKSSINFPMRVKEETDTVPVYIPTPSATKSTKRVILPLNKLSPAYVGVKVEQVKTPSSNFMDNSESSDSNKNMDIISVEKVFSKKTNISDIETAAAHALRPRQLNFVHDHSDNVITPSSKQSEFRNNMRKKVAQTMTRCRSRHTEEERCRRQEIKELFEKLQVTLQLHSLPRVPKRILLEKAVKEIQGLTNQADKLIVQKKLLMHKQDTLIRKASKLLGKTHKAVLKKLQYISAKQKTVEEWKQQQQKTQPAKAVETAETARPYVQDSPCSELKEGILSQSEEKPMMLCTTGSHATENEDSFWMPRIVNVMSFATEENIDINMDINRNPYKSLIINSQSTKSFLPVVSQKANSCGKERDGTDTTEHFTGKKEISFKQIENDSSFKKSPEAFATKLGLEELAQSQMKEKRWSGGGKEQSVESSFQELQVKEPQGVGIEMELQKVAFAIQEEAPDTGDLMDMNDDSDETLTSLLNETAFLNQQLNDGDSDVPEVPNSYFYPGGMESLRESITANGSPFQFGPLGGRFKNLYLVQESSGSVTPLLLRLEDDCIDCDRTLGQPSSKQGALKLLGSEVKDPSLDLSAVNTDGSGKYMEPLSNNTHVSPPILKMKAKLEHGKTDTLWKPMPKLAPFGLKSANFPLNSGHRLPK
ncbi:MAX gene-associated protein-like isoform X2 [Paroedura picta]|uniref:MAX gene-associated protein-like isoform X2 n=1 Tax=Paroedura picta TaxID=143630 RepID=UPI0040572D8D